MHPFYDAVSAITTFTIIGIVVNNEFSINNTLIKLGQSAGVGILVGCILGLFSSMLISEKPYGFLMEHPSKVALGTVCASYTAATILGGSGFMAVFIAGITLTIQASTAGYLARILKLDIKYE